MIMRFIYAAIVRPSLAYSAVCWFHRLHLSASSSILSCSTYQPLCVSHCWASYAPRRYHPSTVPWPPVLNLHCIAWDYSRILLLYSRSPLYLHRWLQMSRSLRIRNGLPFKRPLLCPRQLIPGILPHIFPVGTPRNRHGLLIHPLNHTSPSSISIHSGHPLSHCSPSDQIILSPVLHHRPFCGINTMWLTLSPLDSWSAHQSPTPDCPLPTSVRRAPSHCKQFYHHPPKA